MLWPNWLLNHVLCEHKQCRPGVCILYLQTLRQWKRVVCVPALCADQYMCQGGVLECDVWHDVLSARPDLVVVRLN